MRVAVSIVGFRNAGDVQRCLAALDRSEYRNFEVIVCENGGAAAYAALAEILPKQLSGGEPVRAVLAPGNLGFAGGVNRCLAETPDADAWWILNPDTEPHPEALGAKVARLKVGDRDAVGCTLYRPGGRIQSYGGRWRPWFARAESIGLGRSLEDKVDPAWVERAQNYLNGAAMLVGRKFVDVAGLMRDDYFLYSEEVEWCLRAGSLGLRLGFAPEALVLHAQGTTTGAGEAVTARPRLPVYLAARNGLLVTRDRYPLLLPVAAAATLIQTLVRYGRSNAWAQVGYGVSGLIAGVLNRRGAPAWTGS